MLTLIITIAIMFSVLGIMYMTDGNHAKYKNYQIRQILNKTNLYQLVRE